MLDFLVLDYILNMLIQEISIFIGLPEQKFNACIGTFFIRKWLSQVFKLSISSIQKLWGYGFINCIV